MHKMDDVIVQLNYPGSDKTSRPMLMNKLKQLNSSYHAIYATTFNKIGPLLETKAETDHFADSLPKFAVTELLLPSSKLTATEIKEGRMLEKQITKIITNFRKQLTFPTVSCSIPTPLQWS